MSTTKRPACEECGGKRAHQTHCSYNVAEPVGKRTFEDDLKLAAEGLAASYYFWLSVIEKEAEWRKDNDEELGTYSLTREFARRAGKDPEKNARRILTPPQM